MSDPTNIRRVLVTTDAVGGVWDYSIELARGLSARGIEVILAVMGPEPVRREAPMLPGLTLCHRPFRLEWMPDPWEDVAAAGGWLLELEAEHAPDVVHLNGFVHAAMPWRAPALVVAHSCVLSWWEAVRGGNAPSEWDRYRAEVGAGLRAARQVVAPSHAMLDALQRHHGELPRTAVIPNACSPALYRPAAKEPFVLGVGRWWDEAKNSAALQRAAEGLAWPVWLAGEVPAADAAAPGNVDLLGWCPPRVLAGYYARAAIFALPARYEPFGLAVLEAALSGCALVLGDIASLRENWTDAAVFVPPDDDRALRTALAELVADPARRQSLGDRARERAARFTPERFVTAYLETYARCLSPAPMETVLA